MAKLRFENGKIKHFIYECDFRQNTSQHQQYLKDLIYKTFHKHIEVTEIIVQSHANKRDSQEWLEKEMNLYFGKDKWKKHSRNMISFCHVINDEMVCLVTNNVKYFKKSDVYALMIANNKCVWLKAWQVKECHNFWTEEKAHIVKLTKQYFNPQVLDSNIVENIEDELTWDKILEQAKAQDIENKQWSIQ